MKSRTDDDGDAPMNEYITHSCKCVFLYCEDPEAMREITTSLFLQNDSSRTQLFKKTSHSGCCKKNCVKKRADFQEGLVQEASFYSLKSQQEQVPLQEVFLKKDCSQS